MVKSRLFFRLFSSIVLTVGGFSLAIYLFSVPMVEEKGYEIELNASRTILDNVFEMASKINGSLEDQRAITLESYKRQLREVVSLAASYVDYVFSRVENGELDETEARRLIFEGLRTFKYGNNDYVWVADYNSVLLSHPDPQFQGRDISEMRDAEGAPILPTIIGIAKEKGEGFHTYQWQRLGSAQASEKISYFKNLPSRRLVVGAGVHLDDIDAEVKRGKAAAIEDLRQALRNIRIARTGYVYIFDSANHMLIHPNANIEGTEFGILRDPATGRPIGEELKEAADKDQPLTYMWDKPSDPGNYAYEKISWVRHFPGFDWYITSSVYVDELRRSSQILGNRLMGLAIAIMVVACTLGYFAARRLVRPLNRLAEMAAMVRAGNLEAESGIVRDDEIGVLANAFDGMVRRVRDNIASLDSRVRDRTAALEEVNLRLRDAMASQRRVQAERAEIEARQRLILDAIPASIAYLGRDETVRFANRRWSEQVRWSREEVASHLERTWAGEEVTFETSSTDPHGQMIVTKNTLIPERGPDGEAVVGLFVLSLDVTDEKETAAQLMEAQRMKAVGQLSGGLAHDFNNLLSIILGNLAAAREKYAAVENLDAYLEPAERASRRGADITSRLLAFSRQQPLKPEPVEVCGLVRETAILLRSSLPPTIALTVPAEDRCCWAIADQNQLQNALVNLALNARDAMAAGGRLDIAVGLRRVTEPLSFDEAVVPDEYLEINVADSGSGFVPGALRRAFEPFFTTKTLGSGLGLSMVYGFVKQSRGYIQLDSTAGEGTTVTILLPRADPVPIAVERAAAAGFGEGRWQGELALVVEDDADVRRVLCQQLVDVGLSVVEAVNGDEALELVQQIDDLRIIVSDVVMPGLSGIDLARRVRGLRPDIRMVLVSGFSVSRCGDNPDLVILRKPWQRQDLIDAIGKE
jgi:signal transduction histidine kinase